jgi:RNA polymerase sigma factor (TIGR02999 family)
MEQHSQYRGVSTPPTPYIWMNLACRVSSAPAAAKVGDVVLYDRLRCMASQFPRREGPVHPFEPSDLVHEMFLRMARSEAHACFQTAEHFLAVCAIVMRHILVDHARAAAIFNRGRRIPLRTGGPFGDTLAMRQALQRLARRSVRLQRIVELHVFKGLTFQEIAAALSISSRTAKRGWREALVYLREELDAAPDGPLPTERERQPRRESRAGAPPPNQTSQMAPGTAMAAAAGTALKRIRGGPSQYLHRSCIFAA